MFHGVFDALCGRTNELHTFLQRRNLIKKIKLQMDFFLTKSQSLVPHAPKRSLSFLHKFFIINAGGVPAICPVGTHSPNKFKCILKFLNNDNFLKLL